MFEAGYQFARVGDLLTIEHGDYAAPYTLVTRETLRGSALSRVTLDASGASVSVSLTDGRVLCLALAAGGEEQGVFFCESVDGVTPADVPALYAALVALM